MSGLFTFNLKQSIGQPSLPLVKPGDWVERGSLIAGKPEGLGVNLHSSVSGKVVKSGDDAIAVAEKGTDFSSYIKLKGETPWELVEEAGLVGLGGAGFPTAEKLKTELGPDGTVIINAAECEPVLSHNIARIEEQAGKLLESLGIMMELTGTKRGIVAVKSIHEKAVSELKRMNADGKYEIFELEDLYPMGEERAIVRETLGILLPPDALPSKAGAVVVNAETAFRLREAVVDKKPLIDKDMTVAGKLKENGAVRVLRDVPVGMRVADVFDLAGGLGDEYGELIMGGPFTGKRVSGDDPVLKTTGGLIASECFPNEKGKLGLLVCACGADEKRMEQIAESMGIEVCGVEYCKQAKKVGRALKCENPGHCPGQVEKILNLKKEGATAVLIGNCTDCTNTVMSCAPKLGLKVYHSTDCALRAVNHKLIRKMNRT